MKGKHPALAKGISAFFQTLKYFIPDKKPSFLKRKSVGIHSQTWQIIRSRGETRSLNMFGESSEAEITLAGTAGNPSHLNHWCWSDKFLRIDGGSGTICRGFGHFRIIYF